MTATLERLIDALRWTIDADETCTVVVCHPTTSAGAKQTEPDLIVRSAGVFLYFEVADVASDDPRSNGKELKCLGVLGVGGPGTTKVVPDDAIRRFIATSQQWGTALAQQGQQTWKKRNFRYKVWTLSSSDTVLLEVKRGGS